MCLFICSAFNGAFILHNKYFCLRGTESAIATIIYKHIAELNTLNLFGNYLFL